MDNIPPNTTYYDSQTQTIRVTIQQATMVLAAFMSEQMEQDLQRNELVNTGQLTQLEADVTAEAWEKVRCFCMCVGRGIIIKTERTQTRHIYMYVFEK